MIDRIMKVFTFKQEVYKEVEDDASFTQTAWMIVAVVAFLSQLGASAVLVHVEGAGRCRLPGGLHVQMRDS